MKQLTGRIEQLKKERDVGLYARFFVDKKEKDIADSVGDSCCMDAFLPEFPAKKHSICTPETLEQFVQMPTQLYRDGSSTRSVYVIVQ
ncbi:MAG: hypothetical protein ACI4PM_04380 [Butyricicoccus sp.]